MSTEVGDDDFTVVKLRGLPWEATQNNVINFFEGLEIVEDGIYIAKTSVGRASGEGFVEFIDNENAKAALEKNRKKIDHRYIEIFKSTEEARNRVANAPALVFDISNSKVDKNSTVIRMRGLPWSTTEDDVREFFSPIPVKVVHIIPDHMERASGDGYVEFTTAKRGELAMEKQKKNMGGRYIELFKATPEELSCILVRLNPDVADDAFLVKMRGLPYSATEDEVREFFDEVSELQKVHFIQDQNGKSTGEAFAEFTTEEAVKEALKKNKNDLGSRYVELFKSTVNELKATLRRPANYGRRNYRGGRNRGRGSQVTSDNVPMTKEALDNDIDAYQKKRIKVES